VAVVRAIHIKPEVPGQRGLPKQPVDRATIRRNGIVGDFNRYRHEELHDEPDSALLLLPSETLAKLNVEGWAVRPGDLGENILTEGVPYESMGPGRTLRVGKAVVQVTRACDPCRNLFELPYVGSAKGPEFLRIMLGRRGWYARVLREGEVRPRDPVVLLAQ
jgi:MOSC domain-containing protein YiiM